MLNQVRFKKLNFLLKVIAYCTVLFFSILTSGCNNGGADDPYLYDRIGNDDFQRRNINNVYAPSIHNQPSYPAQNYPAQTNGIRPPVQYQQRQQVQPQYQQRQPQYHQGHGGSRYYNNPYAEAPVGVDPYYYDSDQYYVPPTYYNNVEPQFQRSNRDTTTTGY